MRRGRSSRDIRWGWRVGLPLCWLVGWLLAPGVAQAHVGAPYPVLMEEAVGPYLVSALADPDVGGGTFYLLITLDGAPPPEGTTASVWAEPEDGHRPAVAYPAERQETRYGERYVAEVPFDAEGMWRIRLVVEGPAGASPAGEASFSVRVTPSGTGWLATLACLVPFLVLAALWLRGILRQRGAGG
jgi:hypothetical protein